jgi:hypothetical protein
MSRVAVFVRWLMLLACLVPFTSPRQASAALAPSPNAPVVPAAPVSSGEEDETERAENERSEEGSQAKARAAQHRADRLPAPFVRIAFPTTAPVCALTSVTCPSPADPFRNGLGSPYRC